MVVESKTTVMITLVGFVILFEGGGAIRGFHYTE